MSHRSVFLNVPYDGEFQPLFLAYLVGVRGFGLLPHAALEVPSIGPQIDRIVQLLKTCDYSIHDMSWVGLTEEHPQVPRFNMPFELGMAYWYSLQGDHQCRIFESDHRRFERSLSDLKGFHVYQHQSAEAELFSRLTEAFIDEDLKPSVEDMIAIYVLVKSMVPEILNLVGAKNIFHARAFQEVSFATGEFWAARQVKSRSSHA